MYEFIIQFLFGSNIEGTSFAFLPVLAMALLGGGMMFANYNMQRKQAIAMKQQAELDRTLKQEQERQEELAAIENANVLRDEQRRRRARMEAIYADSGVLLQGSASQALTEQRADDEKNIARNLRQRNAQSRLNQYATNAQFKQDMFGAKIKKQGATIGLISDGLSTVSSSLAVKSSGGYSFDKFKII